MGHRGFEDFLQSGDSLLMAANAEDVAENCIRLINDHSVRLALAKRGQEVVQREFSLSEVCRHRSWRSRASARRPFWWDQLSS